MSHMINDEEPKQWKMSASSSMATWIVAHQKITAITLAAILAVSLFSLWLISSRKLQEYRDFQQADILAEEIQKYSPDSKTNDQAATLRPINEVVAELKTIDDQYPSLQGRYDGLIAEEMLLENKVQNIDPYAYRSIERLRSIGLASFADFSEISRLTGQGLMKEALSQAIQLKERFVKNEGVLNDTDYLLHAFTLLHIATLQHALGDIEASRQSIETLKNYLGIGKETLPLTAQENEKATRLLALLQEKDESLLNYLFNSTK